MKNTGGQPAPETYHPLTEEQRRRQAKEQDGEPFREFRGERVPYLDYYHVDTLLNLQQPRTNAAAEMTFYVMGQVMELLFKLLFVEVNRVRDHLLEDELDDGLWTLRRTTRIQEVLLSCWDPLSTLTATELNEFRDYLGVASGSQSYMYRQLEFALGRKASSNLIDGYRDSSPEIAKELCAALASPSLYDGALTLLQKHGADIPDHCVDRDFTEPYQPEPRVEAAWAEIYRDPVKNRDLYLLGEALVDVAYNFSKWRATHLLVVERLLGDKPGTGGTSGVSWLRTIADHRFFPELWSARSLM